MRRGIPDAIPDLNSLSVIRLQVVVIVQSSRSYHAINCIIQVQYVRNKIPFDVTFPRHVEDRRVVLEYFKSSGTVAQALFFLQDCYSWNNVFGLIHDNHDNI